MLRPHDSPIVRRVSSLLIPLIQLYAFYILFHGHYSPGGGFQGGILFGASLLLSILIGFKPERRELPLGRAVRLGALGLTIYAGIGLLAVLRGGYYLNYALLPIPGAESPFRRFLGILGIEMGVFIVVAATLVIIFYALALAAEKREEL